ncbi:hypothetical protein LCGC14_0429960 [marine sediment metagenome]|uniref:Uncharacterized protein n=1 Tax=marine sediment metagenome TaxID=412755 RepID=A0A0F9SNG8_9ZZZZ
MKQRKINTIFDLSFRDIIDGIGVLIFWYAVAAGIGFLVAWGVS